MKLRQALHTIGAPLDLTAWSIHDYVEALQVVLRSRRVSNVTKAYATGVLQGMLLVISEVEANTDAG